MALQITSEIVRAVANLYTLSDLQEELKKATLQFLQNPERITSASTGAGASYTKALNISSLELVELLSLALEYKKTGVIMGGGSNQWNVAVYSPFNQ